MNNQQLHEIASKVKEVHELVKKYWDGTYPVKERDKLKVVCITHELFGWTDEEPFAPDDPKVGDVCEVIDVTMEYVWSGFIVAYELKGHPGIIYDARNFLIF